MEPTSYPSLRSSGIPRMSRLPIPSAIGTAKPDSNTKHTKAWEEHRSNGDLFYSPKKALRGSTDKEEAAEDHRFKNNGEFRPNDSESATETVLSKARTLHRRPRPSLSDRTMETLSQIPPSPSPRRRQSGFFPSESPLKSLPRPGSSLNRSRPSTSHGQRPPLPSGSSSRPCSPTKRHLAPTTGNPLPKQTPSRRSVSSSIAKNVSSPTIKASGLGIPTPSRIKPSASSNPSPTKAVGSHASNQPISKATRNSKTLSARPSKPRLAVQDVFMKPPDTNAIFSPNPKKSSAASSVLGEFPSKNGVSNSEKVFKSSAQLREQIAKAKAAKQKKARLEEKGSTGVRQQTDAFPELDFGDTATLLRNRVASARADGKLNIAALNLKQIPTEVMNMYKSSSSDMAWYESVDLKRLTAADNEFDNLDAIFPDDIADSHDEDGDAPASPFEGLETLDLHGNRMNMLPMGLRRLERLTSLNVSKNRLTNDSIATICQLQSLKELRLADNSIKGELTPDLRHLEGLQILDVHNNLISDLPRELNKLLSLRTLDISGNRIESLSRTLSELALVELDAARNRLGGALIDPEVQCISTLRSLDVAHNALTSIAEGSGVELPSLHTLNATENRLKTFPDITNWRELLTLIVGGNQLDSLPEGLTDLPKLRNVDFSRNDIKKLDARLGSMDNLTSLRIANNPLRERRFLKMTTDEIKRELKAQIVPEETANLEEHEQSDIGATSSERTTVSCDVWPLKPNGILDRSSTKIENVESRNLEPFIATGNVKALMLNRNHLQTIPQAVEMLGESLVRLEISFNTLANTGYILSKLSLPTLKSLDLSSNAITDLAPLVYQFAAPKLSELNVCRNQLSYLPPLREHYPGLVSILAANNRIKVLEFENVRGLQVLDASGNELMHLEPKLGLLASEGLRSLNVGGNRFRVPRRDVIDKGTEAVLTWLRSKIPDENM